MTTKQTDTRRFRGGDYVARLMAELEEAAISERLQHARKQAGLTQQQMADLLQVHKRSVEDYESKLPDKPVPYDRINEWARLTKTTPEWLLHGDDRAAATPAEIQELREQLADVRRQLGRIERLLLSQRGDAQ